MSKKKKIIIALISLAVLLLALYIGVSVFFRSHFYPRTYLGEIKASGLTVDEVETKVSDGVKSYELTLLEAGNASETITAEDISLQSEKDESLNQKLKNQIGFDWPAHLFQDTLYEKSTLVTFDEEALKKVLKALECMDSKNQVKAKDAYLSYDTKKGFTIEASVPGTVIDEKNFVAEVTTAVLGLVTELDMEASGVCYVQPIKEDSDEMKALLEKAEKCLKAEITFDVGDDPTVLDKNTFAEWISVENGKIVLDEKAMDEYVTDLCHKYNTCYKEKDFKTSYGVNVAVTNVHYGWQVNYDDEYAQIKKEILAGDKVKRDLNYKMKAASHTGADYGNSYVECNRTAQHLFLYIDGACVLESDFVSGNCDGSHETPPGIWGITYCERNATLRGPGYATKVGYWMPFNGDIGLHDATWRTTGFGAAIYMRDGSHGCVNLPGDVAATIFSYVEANFPVIVYDLPGSETEANLAQQAAYGTIDCINAIGAVSEASEPAIATARASYDALSELGKTYVDNYQLLLDAEATWAAMHPQPVVQEEKPTKNENETSSSEAVEATETN